MVFSKKNHVSKVYNLLNAYKKTLSTVDKVKKDSSGSTCEALAKASRKREQVACMKECSGRGI